MNELVRQDGLGTRFWAGSMSAWAGILDASSTLSLTFCKDFVDEPRFCHLEMEMETGTL